MANRYLCTWCDVAHGLEQPASREWRGRVRGVLHGLTGLGRWTVSSRHCWHYGCCAYFSLHYVFATSLERRKQFGGHHPAKSLAKEPRLPIPHHDRHQIHDAFARRAAANAGQALDARKYVVGTTWLRMAQLSTIRGCLVTPESRPLDRLAAACLAVHPRLDCEPRGYVFRAVVLMEMGSEAVMV